jgi:NADPH:quinone reductase-like Zn-dependent oxidoreductase
MPKIVRFHQVGGPEVLKLEELPAPKPQKDEVLIKVDAIGLNRAEAMFRSGQYLEQPELPSGLGYEASGTVEEVGPGVTGQEPGDRVIRSRHFRCGHFGPTVKSRFYRCTQSRSIRRI